MTSNELDLWFSRLLPPDEFEGIDPSMNGLQVDNDGAPIERVAFAVDASQETINRAVSAGAGMLFVHHGLFWRFCEPVRGAHYKRLKTLMASNLALYASHLPLDIHGEVGNNAGLADKIGLEGREPFGDYKGCAVGVRGTLPSPVPLDTALTRIFGETGKPLHVLPFGKREIRTVAVVSGSGSDDVHEAISLGIDLFVTGEISHEIYHGALENGIHVVAAGHYYSETFGPRLVAARLARETGLDCVFIDVPTGL